MVEKIAIKNGNMNTAMAISGALNTVQIARLYETKDDQKGVVDFIKPSAVLAEVLKEINGGILESSGSRPFINQRNYMASNIGSKMIVPFMGMYLGEHTSAGENVPTVVDPRDPSQTLYDFANLDIVENIFRPLRDIRDGNKTIKSATMVPLTNLSQIIDRTTEARDDNQLYNISVANSPRPISLDDSTTITSLSQVIMKPPIFLRVKQKDRFYAQEKAYPILVNIIRDKIKDASEDDKKKAFAILNHIMNAAAVNGLLTNTLKKDILSTASPILRSSDASAFRERLAKLPTSADVAVPRTSSSDSSVFQEQAAAAAEQHPQTRPLSISTQANLDAERREAQQKAIAAEAAAKLAKREEPGDKKQRVNLTSKK